MKTLNWKILLGFVVLIFVMACGGSGVPIPQTSPPATAMPTEKATLAAIPEVTYTGETLPVNALVVYHSNRTGNYEIYSSFLDGSDLKQLTNDPAEDTDPDISPDGSKIVFTSTRDGNREIYVMDADGGNLVRLTNDPADDLKPVWSPNGKVIAFTSRRNGNADIYLISADGSQIAPYTTWPSDEMDPTWNPTDPEIAFTSNKDGDYEIYVMGSDGKFRQLTQNDTIDLSPDWSSNGRFIVFCSDPNKADKTTNLTEANLMLVEPDGAGLQQVTSIPGLELEPVWSPDSNYILFSSLMTGSVDIFLIQEDGTFYRITNNSAVDAAPSWGGMITK